MFPEKNNKINIFRVHKGLPFLKIHKSKLGSSISLTIHQTVCPFITSWVTFFESHLYTNFPTDLFRKWLVRVVVPHMFQTGTWLSECFFTMITLVRTNTSVCSDVANQCELDRKGLATDVTLVRTHTSVNATVTLQIIGLCECFLTDITLKWTNTSVNELMSGQCIPVSKCFVADITLECLLFAVCPHVRQKRRLECKGPSTNLAGIWFNSSVSAAVSLKAALLRKGTATKVTLVRLLSSVYKLVSLQMLQESELFAALCALVLFHTSMDQFVAL